MDWLGRNTESNIEDQIRILNAGLHMAMEWGDEWLKPIQDRLSMLYPFLSDEQLNNCNTLCRTVMQYANEMVCDLLEEVGTNGDYKLFEEAVLTKYSWVNFDNLSRLYSQSMYYAMK